MESMSFSQEHYPFSLHPLPYAYDALEPYIDCETMHIHHDKHLKAYVDNLNSVLCNHSCYHTWSLEKLLCNIHRLPCEIRTVVKNNAGGVYNHNLFFSSLAPVRDCGCAAPRSNSALEAAMERQFGACDQFLAEMRKNALSVFGSGWTYLVMTSQKRLKIVNFSNQDTPVACGYCPILPLDVWEHAYYLKYQNRRGDYIDNWAHVINDEFMQAAYCKAMM